jgi:hypothetical protein
MEIEDTIEFFRKLKNMNTEKRAKAICTDEAKRYVATATDACKFLDTIPKEKLFKLAWTGDPDRIAFSTAERLYNPALKMTTDFIKLSKEPSIRQRKRLIDSYHMEVLERAVRDYQRIKESEK